MTYTLTLIDTRAVQKFIFSANKLKQNIGASHLVNQSTTSWVEEALDGYRHNIKSGIFELDESFRIEKNDGDVEILYSGGGNVAMIFTGKKEEKAIPFTQRYTRLLFEKAPGLRVSIGHVEFNWKNNGGLSEAWENLHEDIMPRRKTENSSSQPIFGLGVTADCAYTGTPAIGEKEGVLISAEVQKKLEAVDEANLRLQKMLRITRKEHDQFKPFEYPFDHKLLGSSEGKGNYIAVVHIDGNNMGKRLKDFIGKNVTDNRELIRRMRSFSQSVRLNGETALKAVRDAILNNLQKTEDGWQLVDKTEKDKPHSRFTLKLEEKNFPIRPIVFGGDDVTFVCAGNLGLSLAATYIKAFSNRTLEDGKPGFACAGVAIVHTNYPFAEANALAVNLTNKAKESGRMQTDNTGDASLINWCYSTSSIQATWEQVKRARYRVESGDLTVRPLFVNTAPEYTFNARKGWETFLEIIHAFRGTNWNQNKLKVLLTALKGGPDAVSAYTTKEQVLPAAANFDEAMRKTGWSGQNCLYFDALEVNDIFLELEGS